MGRAVATQKVARPEATRVSVPITAVMLQEIDNCAERSGVSRSSLLAKLLQMGLEAEQKRYDQFVQKIRQYRECPDTNEANRLGDEIGEMIFGR
jgi:hypothetical protein